ncbi:L-Ala-D/L-Glu epimerase [Oceanobacillus oncorhynchi subsp. incaldanensis]|uniref:Dipeptide epimerase n=1 Tax=Oceanobacillus oncorhynchi TaxID=545501 RepID=A0A0A1M6B2_9BACI|nr:dipeptide epimerase [Oceanobacillus oncorhynchi]GIO20128.1 L-Ala-D/L-Glu epimerase [Oceanobacillus oncorhynchi subsp. incaldanensis]CEI80790.1 L-Ala-D/L-Glu epimerase [Oceanobacillus oncorhynchi]
MKIVDLELYHSSIPLHTPFKTALRTVTIAESIVVKITCDNGITGWGEAPPTHVITGESLASIHYAMDKVLRPVIIDASLCSYAAVFARLEKAITGNTSAKAAVDMALYDCLAQAAEQPLYQYLGGYRSQIENDYTVSVNETEQMEQDAKLYKENGFRILKVKVGKDPAEKDIERVAAIRKAAGEDVLIRLDANQGWTAKEAVKAITQMEELGLNLELVEQPVPAHDVQALKYITERTTTPIMADEAVFSTQDACRVLEMGAADLINIKLMKSGGIHQAIKIANLAQDFGVSCMVGSMIETKLGITAAAHFAASHPAVTRFDFDAPLMLSDDILEGGIQYQGKGNQITFSNQSGLGIKSVKKAYLQTIKREGSW